MASLRVLCMSDGAHLKLLVHPNSDHGSRVNSLTFDCFDSVFLD